MLVVNIVSVFSGLFWSLAYVLIIRRGFADKTFGMPLVPLCFNLSWEFIFGFVLPYPRLQQVMVIAWFGLDLVILYQYLKFGRLVDKRPAARRLFYPVFWSTLIFSFFTVLLVTYEFRDWAGNYISLGQNLIMSMLFIGLLLERDDLSGQSLWIAICKMLGTLAASINILAPFYDSRWFFHDSRLLWFFAVSILFYDIAYCYLVYAKSKELRIDPWARL